MGLFSSKKKTYVSSVAYPLGEDDGPTKQDFLKYTVLNSVITQQPSIADSMTRGYLRGQGMSLRNVFIYARDRYTHGVPGSDAQYLTEPDRAALTEVLSGSHPGYTIEYLAVAVSTADFEWWAEKFLAEEYGYDRVLKTFDRPPQGVEEDAAVAYDLEPSGLIQILLMNSNGSIKVVEHRPKGYVQMQPFVHACYRGTQDFVSKVETTTRPAEPEEIDSVSVHVTEVVRPGGEVHTTTERTSTTIDGSTDTATVVYRKTVRVETRPQYFLYQLGTGKHASLDAWLSDSDLQSPYYPAIPIRVDNVDMVHPDKQDTPLYKTSKKLLDRVGIDIDEIGTSLNDNDSIDDIDYAFVVFGVQLNVQSQEGKRYLFEYFQYLRGITSTQTTKESHQDWTDRHDQVQVQMQTMRLGGMGPMNTGGNNQSTPPAVNEVQIYSKKNRKDNYDVKIQWDYIDTTIHSGEAFPGAKIGDVGITMGGEREERYLMGFDLTVDSSKLYARRQLDENSYEQLEISGLVYENFIYDGKSVIVTAYDQFHDEDEEGFIIPLNHQIVRSMSLRDVTDLAYHCMHMVINCYQIVKQRWYQRGWFKILLIIVAIIITVVTWGADGGASIGAAISSYGAAAGMAATTVLLLTYLAATVYVLGMMVLMRVLGEVGGDLLGEEYGAIFAMVVTFLAMNWGNISASLKNLSANQVMNASTAVVDAYAKRLEVRIGQTLEDITKLQDEWEEKFDELDKMMEEMLGTNLHLLDVQAMIDSTYSRFFERMDQFLGRTLMTGNDVADITLGQVDHFAELGLQLPGHG